MIKVFRGAVGTMHHHNKEYGALSALTSMNVLGFKFLAWLNGTGVLLIMLCSVGVIELGFGPQWLRLPLTTFLAGLALCALGLLWAYMSQSSRYNQMLAGQVRRSHWLPQFCATIAYGLSLACFALGCWFTQTMAAVAYLH